MTELKTKVNDASVADFLNTVPDAQVRQDCGAIIDVMRAATDAGPKMWGPAIIGFGQYHYKYSSGREADWMLIGFSPRKNNISLYITGGFEGYEDLVGKLGKITRGKGCLYVKRISDINLPALEALVRASVQHVIETHTPTQG